MAHSVTVRELKSLVDGQDSYALVDVRERGEFNQAQIFGATSLPRRELEFHLPRLVPVSGTLLVLCDDDGRRAALAASTVERMGYTNVATLEGGLDAWSVAGHELVEGTNTPSKDFGEKVLVQQEVPEIEPEELYARIQSGERLTILDCRTPEEFQRSTIPGSRSVPGGELALRITDIMLEQGGPVIVHCAGRTRSIIGTRVLNRMGLTEVVGLKNGTMGWLLAGYQLQEGTALEPLPSPSKEGLAAAEEFASRLAAEDGVAYMSVDRLQELLARRQEETLYLVDVRGAGEYEDGHIPGSVWIPGGQAVQRTDEVVAVRNGTVVLVCDGRVRATVTASWYRQMGLPNVYVLDGGVTAWRERGLALEKGSPDQPPAGLDDANALTSFVAPARLRDMLDRVDAPLIVDLETSRDFGRGHLPGARWVPRGWLEIRIGDYAASKESPIVLTCKDGVSSVLAGAALRELGYTQVSVLEGGTGAWQAEGLSLEDGLSGM
ncbi:MAG: sulfurtransferase, partial [Chloroflexi bacterium]|nr:sulfurtransferase [Chloroflexota bacterium]